MTLAPDAIFVNFKIAHKVIPFLRQIKRENLLMKAQIVAKFGQVWSQ